MEVAGKLSWVLSVFVILVLERSEVLDAFTQSLDSDFTFTLSAGRRECFFQTMKKDASLEIEYQIFGKSLIRTDYIGPKRPYQPVMVIHYRLRETLTHLFKEGNPRDPKKRVLDGAGLDVDFFIFSPSGQVLFKDVRKSDGVHTVETEEGDYMFCFDNTFSAISEKLIFFELILDNMVIDGNPEEWKEYVHGTDTLDMKLEDIMDTINNVKSRLGKSMHIQTVLRAFEARDRNLQESNYDRVNFWSVVNLIVMMMVSTVQVYLVRSLFDDKRKVRT